MALLVVKKSSWWELNTKQAMVWVPVATLQMSTMAGLGYFYHRLSDLEAQTESLSSLDATVGQPVRTTLRQEDKPQLRTVGERILPKPAPVPLQVALDRPEILGTMSAGGVFFTPVSSPVKPVETVLPDAGKAAALPAKAPTASPNRQAKKVVSSSHSKHVTEKKRVEPAVVKPVASSRPASSIPRLASYAEVEATRTAEANRSGFDTAGDALHIPELPADEVLAAVMPIAPAITTFAEPVQIDTPEQMPMGSKKPLPVGTVTWVYLGELRDYGWHGQRLHVAPDSGLPLVGSNYHTQELHGLYDRPHGNRSMGGFQQGDLITILEVVHESNRGVWAKVRKAQSVGRLNR